MKKILILLAVVIVVLLSGHAFFSYRHYNVILITIDTFRRDFSTCYNPGAPSTPNIDRIAQAGVLFKNAFTLIPLTLPAHSSIMTSRPPHELDLFQNGDVLEHKFLLLSELLEKEGYHTAAFVSMGVLKSVFGLKYGFQTYRDDFNKLGRWYIVASEVNSLALPWIEKQGNSPFFAWIHYSDPHEPYITVNAPPDTEITVNGRPYGKICLAKKEQNVIDFVAQPGENKIEFRTIEGYGINGRIVEYVSLSIVKPRKTFELKLGEGWESHKHRKGLSYYEGSAMTTFINPGKEPVPVRLAFDGRGKVLQTLDVVRGNYSAEVQYLDEYLGILWDRLAELGIRNKTIVILTADHGEGLAEHGRVGHGFPLYKEVLQVPLIIYYPNLGWKGKKIYPIVNHLDIMPTILDLLHIRNGNTMRGQSLKRYISWSPLDRLSFGSADRPRTFFYTYAPQGRADSFSILQGNLKLIQTRSGKDWKWESYDLSQDPMERNNLAVTDIHRFNVPEISSLRALLMDQSREAEEAFGLHKNPTLNEEQKRMLRDLGYVNP